MNNKWRIALSIFLSVNTLVLADGTPKIKFDSTVYDFGPTSLVETVTGTFTFHNAGDGVLKIDRPKPSCGCTIAQVSPDTLEPGAEGKLVFTLTLGSGSHRLEKLIYVPSNDPAIPSAELHIKAVTQSVLQTEPPSVSLGDMPLGTVTNVTVTVRRLDGKNLSITKAEPSTDQVHATIGPRGEPDALSQRLSVEVKAAGMPRTLSDRIQIYTDDSVGAAFTLFVNARLLGSIKLEPEALAWGMPDPEQWSGGEMDVILSRSILVSAAKPDQPLKLSKLTSSLKELKLKLETIEKNRQYLIEAALPHRLTKPLSGTISFETNLPDLPKVEVPVEISVWKN